MRGGEWRKNFERRAESSEEIVKIRGLELKKKNSKRTEGQERKDGRENERKKEFRANGEK